jgi:Flp pilus assembly protein TadB
VTRPSPPCPACGSSSTLPFESDDQADDRQPVAEVVLGSLLFFLALFVVFLFFLLSRASLPAAVLLLMTVFLFWRRQKEKRRRARSRPRAYVCLDCSHNFRAL